MADEKGCRELVRQALVHAAEHRRYLAFCEHDDFERWEDEVEYHGWMKTEEVLTDLARSLGVNTEGVTEEAARRLREEYEDRMARAPETLRRVAEPVAEREAAARRPEAAASQGPQSAPFGLWAEEAAAREALRYGPAILYALDHEGSLDGCEPAPEETPTANEAQKEAAR